MLSSFTTTNNKIKKLQLPAYKKIMFSNNITSLNVVSTLAEEDIDRSKLTNI